MGNLGVSLIPWARPPLWRGAAGWGIKVKSLGVKPWGLCREKAGVWSHLSAMFPGLGKAPNLPKMELPTSGFELLTGLCQEQVKWPQKSESMEKTWERVVGLPCLQSQSPVSYSQACAWLWWSRQHSHYVSVRSLCKPILYDIAKSLAQVCMWQVNTGEGSKKMVSKENLSKEIQLRQENQGSCQ